MKYAIFNSFPFHFEMFAHVLDYFKENNQDIDIYTNITGANGWLKFYETKYGVKRWSSITEFNPTDYDYVFLLTDDDPAYACFWNETTRVIVIEHDSNRSLALPAYRTLQTRQFMHRTPPTDSNTWIIPIWNEIPSEKYEPLTVMAVGNAAIFVAQILPALFTNFSDIQFILVDRHMTTGVNANIKSYNNLDTTTLLEMAGKSHYILFWPTTGFSQNHKYDSLTASVPLAYSVGSPLILPSDFAEALGLQGTLGIQVGHHLTKPTMHLTNQFTDQRHQLIERRNRIFADNIHAIPKQIFQTFETKEFSPRFQEIIDLWKKHNPQYKYIIHDAGDREAFIKRNFDKRVYEAYNLIIPGAYKADLWRYCILYVYGGVYIDIDTLCISSLDTFLTNNTTHMMPIDLNPGHEGYHNLSNGFIASVAKSPIMMNCIDRVVHHVHTHTIPPSKLDFSGPGVLGRAVNTYLGRDELTSFVGQEGIRNGIHFLKFERGTEYIKDNAGNILFQNKNGNWEIDALYRVETQKARTICWVTATEIIRCA